MKNFPTPRLLLEARKDGVWKAVKIYCDYATIRKLLTDLPILADAYKCDINDMRVKNLLTTQAIADAKQAVYENQKRRKSC
jgi:hypothetical protein